MINRATKITLLTNHRQTNRVRLGGRRRKKKKKRETITHMRNKHAGVCSRTAILPRGQQHRRHPYDYHLDSVAAGMSCACGNAHVHSEIQRTNRLFECAKRKAPQHTNTTKAPEEQLITRALINKVRCTLVQPEHHQDPMDTSLPSQVRRHPRHRSYCSATATRRRGQIPVSK
jgi:hypothetical protein